MNIQLSTPGDRRASAVISIVFHVGVLLLIWFFMKFQYPDPPLGSQSMEVAVLGDTYSAGGNSTTNTQPKTSPQPAQSTPTETESMTTTDSPSDVVVQDNPNPDPVTETTSPPVDQPVEEAAEPEPTISDGLADALSGLGNSGSNDGSGQNQGAGQEGSSDGKIDGQGVIGGGEGFGFSLAGRGIIGKPNVNGNPAEEGTIVFDIWVDKEGNLDKFKYNPVLSTSSAGKNIQIAEKALATVSFNANPKAPHIQKGQFTFVFKLN